MPRQLLPAKARGIPVYAVEMGYLRPDWIRLERSGSGYNSHFPSDPETIVEAASGLPEPDFKARYKQKFAAEAAYDLLFNLPNVFLWFFFPHYRWHAIFHPLAEYAGWIGRFLKGPARKWRRGKTIRQVVNAEAPVTSSFRFNWKQTIRSGPTRHLPVNWRPSLW